MRVDLPGRRARPHDYVTGERLRLEVYRKIAEAGDAAALEAIVDELTDRYGEPPVPVRNLLAVAAFRQTCRTLGVAEVAVGGNGIRIGPSTCPTRPSCGSSDCIPKAAYRAATRAVVVPRPMESGRIGGAPLRDVELLDWCTTLLRDVLVPSRVPAPV